METISELLASLLILSIAIIFLTESFYNIIRNKIHKIHSHTSPTKGVDKAGEEEKGIISHVGNGASRLLTFFPLLTFSLLFLQTATFTIKIIY